jgi:histidinol-phosphate aminotransferase
MPPVPGPVSTAPAGVRPVVRSAPDYPFTHYDAPVKLDQNESPHDFPPELKAKALERMAAAAWNRYPDMHAEGLRALLAEVEGWSAEGIVVTPGSNVLIHALADAAGIGQKVLTVSPAFSLYSLLGELLGERLVQVPLLDGFQLPVEQLQAELREGPGLVYLAEPHAPTGVLHDLESVRAIVQAAGPQWLVVLDEAYYQFAGRDHKDLVLERENVLILRTMSKAWGLGGIRVGYALARPELAAQVRKLVLPFNLSTLAGEVARVALENPGYAQERAAVTVRERERVFAALREHPTWEVYPSSANYLLVRTPNAPAAWRALLDRGVLVRRQDSYPGLQGCLRVTIGTPEENDAFLAAAKEIA